MSDHPALLKRSPQPVFPFDQPWEAGGRVVPVSALADPSGDGLRLYYMLRPPGRPKENVLCLAHTKDGVVWEKRDFGDGTNIVMRGSGHTTDWGEFFPTSVIFDEHETDAERRWKLIYWDSVDPTIQSGIGLATSPDGVKWNRLHSRPVITGANDAASMIDMYPGIKTPFGAGTHFIHQQTLRHNPHLPTERDNLKQLHRGISVWQCERFDGRWIGPVGILQPDEKDAPDVQFYWLAAFKNPQGGYGGFLNIHHTIDQTMDTQLVSSRDGWAWTRENNRRPILPLGPRGQFDCGLVCAICQPVVWQGRVLVFYQGRPTVHDGKPRYPEADQPDPGIGVAEFSEKLFELGSS